MATKTKVPTLVEEDDLDEELEETMAKSNKLASDPLVIAVPHKDEGPKQVMTTVRLDELPGSGSEGIKVDQYEHVTIANEMGEKCYKILRGEPVEVPIEVYIALKARYGNKI